MLETLATQLTDRLYSHCPLDQSKKAVYRYGFQLSLSTLASTCSIIVLGILSGDAPSAFLFLGVFFFLRLFAGGFHASTYSRCFLLTNSIYLAVILISNHLVYFHLYYLLPVITVASCVTIIVLAPIRNKNHPLSERTYLKNRKIAIILSLLESFVFVALSQWESFFPYTSVSVLSLAAVAVMMLITRKGRRVKQ